MRFRKPWLWVKSISFNFSAKSSSTDYMESNKPKPEVRSSCEIREIILNFRFQKVAFFTFFVLLKSLLFTLSHG